MPLSEKEKAYIWDMLDAAIAIEDFVRGKLLDDYMSNRMLRGAVERHIEIIGEAARRISEESKQEYAEIPWRAIVGQRNVLAHDYGEVLHEAIWAIATRRIPELVSALRNILPNDPSQTD